MNKSIQQEDIVFVNSHLPNIGAPKCIKKILTDLKEENCIIQIIVGDFNTPLTSMVRSSRKKINKEILALNNTLELIALVDIYRTFYSKTAEYTFSSSAHGTFSRLDHMLGHKTSLNKFKKFEIISSIFYEHSGMKLGINYKKKTGKVTNTWILNNMLLNNQRFNKEIKGEIKKYLETNENGNTILQNL